MGTTFTISQIPDSENLYLYPNGSSSTQLIAYPAAANYTRVDEDWYSYNDDTDYVYSTATNIVAQDTLTVPIFVNIEKKLVEEDERLLLRVYMYNNSATAISAGSVFIACYNSSSPVDMQIKIPYAYSG